MKEAFLWQAYLWKAVRLLTKEKQVNSKLFVMIASTPFLIQTLNQQFLVGTNIVSPKQNYSMKLREHRKKSILEKSHVIDTTTLIASSFIYFIYMGGSGRYDSSKIIFENHVHC